MKKMSSVAEPGRLSSLKEIMQIKYFIFSSRRIKTFERHEFKPYVSFYFYF